MDVTFACAREILFPREERESRNSETESDDWEDLSQETNETPNNIGKATSCSEKKRLEMESKKSMSKMRTQQMERMMKLVEESEKKVKQLEEEQRQLKQKITEDRKRMEEENAKLAMRLAQQTFELNNNEQKRSAEVEEIYKRNQAASPSSKREENHELSNHESFLREKIQFVRKLLRLLRDVPQPISLRNVMYQKGSALIQPRKIRKMQQGYWAPEVFREEKGQEEKHVLNSGENVIGQDGVLIAKSPKKCCEISFVYTFGVFIIHLISEQLPFNQYDYPQLLYNVGSGNLLHQVPAGCPSPLDDIISECCRFNPETRPTFRELSERYSTALEIAEVKIGPANENYIEISQERLQKLHIMY